MNCLKRQERKGADFRKQVVFEVDKLEYTSLDETFLQRAIDCVNAHLNDVEFGQAEFVSEMGASRTVLTEKLTLPLQWASTTRNISVLVSRKSTA